MKTKHLLRKLPSCLLGAIFVAGVASTTMVNAVDGNPPGLFELEGNVTDEAKGVLPNALYTIGDDWESLFDGTAKSVNGAPIATTEDENAGSSTFGTLIVSDPAPKSIFTQGGSKDVLDVSNWKHTDGSVPDKDDITHAYAAAYINPTATGPHKVGDLIIYFGLDRYANNGDANAGFWFFQNEVKAGPGGTFVDSAGNPAKHVAMRADPGNPGKFLPGDVFVIVKYPQASDAFPIIKVYEWDPNDADKDGNKDPAEKGGKFSPLDLLLSSDHAECDQSGGKVACAISNLIDLPAPSWGYTPKSGTGLPFESVFEGGINISNLLGTSPCFASFLAETRSSESQTAQLKDFVLASFPVCGIDVEKFCAAKVNSSGNGLDVSFNGTLENEGAGAYIAYLKDSVAGASIDHVCIDTGDIGCSDDPDVTGLVKQADGSAYFPLAGGATVFYEGHYGTSGIPGGGTTSDTVKALAFAKVADVPASGQQPNPALVIVDDSDTATCPFDVTVSAEIFKECSVAFVEGDTVKVTYSGYVKNTGNVPLSQVKLVDSDFGTLTFPTTLAVGSGEVAFGDTVSVPKSSLGVSESAPDANGVVTVSLQHSNKATVTAKALGDNNVELGAVNESWTANCPGSFTRGILVEKDCDKVILEPENGKLVVKVQVTAKVTNIGDEDLSGIVLSDDPAVVFDSYSATLAGGSNASFTVNGYYYPSSDVDLTNLTPLEFSDLASVTANGVFSGGASSDSDDADCPLCPTP
ncbi:hypothetical protein [Pseudomonas zhanjiangensis]|uniref:Uncharacterized protein n=1 Tax=Pseudomonas zhanjiangensis TaxID=3239015 RepID=A0ABV3YNA7_9PSED